MLKLILLLITAAVIAMIVSRTLTTHRCDKWYEDVWFRQQFELCYRNATIYYPSVKCVDDLKSTFCKVEVRNLWKRIE